MSDELKRRLKDLMDRSGTVKDPRDRSTRFKKPSELDSYNKFVDKISAGIMGPVGSALGRNLSKAELAEIEGFRPTKELTQRLMRKAGASPGKVKAVTGEAMSRGGEVGVVDLTTQIVIDE